MYTRISFASSQNESFSSTDLSGEISEVFLSSEVLELLTSLVPQPRFDKK